MSILKIFGLYTKKQYNELFEKCKNYQNYSQDLLISNKKLKTKNTNLEMQLDECEAKLQKSQKNDTPKDPKTGKFVKKWTMNKSRQWYGPIKKNTPALVHVEKCIERNTAMSKIINFKPQKYVTKWGHEFDTKKEYEAFIEGMEYMAENLSVCADNLFEGLFFTKKE